MTAASASATTAAIACIWSQMRFIRCCIQMRRHAEGWREYWVKEPAACAAMLACAAAVALPEAHAHAGLVLVLTTTLVYDYVNAPYEVDNGGTLEAWTSALLLAAVDDVRAGVPWLKLAFASVYLAAAVAKLNADYFDWRRSANTAFIVQFAADPPFFGPRFAVSEGIMRDGTWRHFLRIALLALEAVEFAIPVLIYASPRVGVAVDWTFHLIVGMKAFDFSSIGMAILPLMLPLDALAPAFAWMTTTAPARCLTLAAMALLTIGYAPATPGRSGMRNGGREKLEIHAAWLVWSFLICAGLLMQMRIDAGSAEDEAAFIGNQLPPARAAMAAAASGALLLTCAAPYLGLPRTSSTFTMFSNLVVEGGYSNHFLYRSKWAPFGFLRDLVTVTDTNLEAIRYFVRRSGPPRDMHSMRGLIERHGIETAILGNSKMGGGGTDGGTAANTVFPYRIPYMQLRQLVAEARARDFYVEYSRRDGGAAAERFELRDNEVVRGDARLRERLPFVVRKFVFCRAITMGFDGVCYV